MTQQIDPSESTSHSGQTEPFIFEGHTGGSTGSTGSTYSYISTYAERWPIIADAHQLVSGFLQDAAISTQPQREMYDDD